LVQHGADVNAKDAHKLGADSGWTALDIARQHGDTPIVAFLLKSGAKSNAAPPPQLKPRRDNTIDGAIQGSLPLIQKADANFMPKAACASCHNNSFAAMAVGSARRIGFAVDEKIAAQQVQGNVLGLMQMRDNLRQGFIAPVGEYFGPVVVGFMLLGLDAEHYKADLNTDTAAIYLKNRQGADGHWAYLSADTRPPICSDYIAQTAIAMRAMQLYAPKLERASYDQAIQLAAAWLAKQQPKGNEDRVARLEGLVWSGKYKDTVQKAMRDLIATQRSDGGWADIDTTPSTAFATGRALVALQTAGLPVLRRRISEGRELPPRHAGGGRLLVCPQPLHDLPAVFRFRLPARLRSMDLRRRHQLGNPRPLAGSARAYRKRRRRTVNGRQVVRKDRPLLTSAGDRQV
jgi:cytochrome c553